MIDACIAMMIVSLLTSLTISFATVINSASTKINQFDEIQEIEYENIIQIKP